MKHHGNEKIEERLYLDLFRKLESDFPRGKIIPSESPDFLIKTKHRTVGIEMTRMMPLYMREESFETANEAPKRWLVGTETLQMILDKKEEKLNLYQSKKLNAYWLIIVVPPLSLAQFELPPQLLHFKFHTRFNRVFLLLADQKKLMVIA
ncbi:MAG: hypothetical protein IT219_08635 [Bacteroidales bacterium]|nr:hypothetical protein [Bacteroidales bacterium]